MNGINKAFLFLLCSLRLSFSFVPHLLRCWSPLGPQHWPLSGRNSTSQRPSRATFSLGSCTYSQSWLTPGSHITSYYNYNPSGDWAQSWSPKLWSQSDACSFQTCTPSARWSSLTQFPQLSSGKCKSGFCCLTKNHGRTNEWKVARDWCLALIFHVLSWLVHVLAMCRLACLNPRNLANLSERKKFVVDASRGEKTTFNLF